MRIETIQDAYSQAIYAENTLSLESLIEGSSSFTTRMRVDIYRNNTIGSLKKTLSQVFPVCEALVGEKYFKQLAHAHIAKNPSISRNLDDYGEAFSQTLEQLIGSRDELQDLAYLADVARLEWLNHQSYYAIDRTVFDIETFSQLSENEQTAVCFKLAADVGLMTSPYPVYDIWLTHQSEDLNTTVEINVETDAEIDGSEHYFILVQRPQWKTHTKVIDEPLYRLLLSIKQGESLLALAGLSENSAMGQSMGLTELIQQGIIVGFE